MCPGQCDCSMMEIHDLKELTLQKLNRAAKISSLFTRESGHYCIIIAEGHALFCFDKYLNFFFSYMISGGCIFQTLNGP